MNFNEAVKSVFVKYPTGVLNFVLYQDKTVIILKDGNLVVGEKIEATNSTDSIKLYFKKNFSIDLIDDNPFAY